ncbi:hypothetical protein ABIE44_001662 [Marmoricola sp. OAE513]|uniref:hypothetical protein n=1 Tax=Marmoricola sp. OAE513 TaxID=2817894 RepID=UPI001AEB3207
MFKSFSTVPIGVWAGAVVVLLAAWLKDGWGFILGALIIGFTMFTTAYAEKQRQAEAAEPEDDGWGVPPEEPPAR